MFLGAHLSVAGGVDKAFDRAGVIECTAFQIFTKSNRQWKAKDLEPELIELFHQRRKACGLDAIVCHASYLLNLGTQEPAMWQKSVDALIVELDRCEQLQIPYLVLHPGSHVGGGLETGIRRVIEALDTVHARLPGCRVKIALEITAGQGDCLGAKFEEIAQMRSGCRQPERVVVCFDTCHALAAGYEFRTPESYEAMIQEFDRIIGLELLKVCHLNDSAADLGSQVDRHAHIGEGYIGLEPFGYFLNDPRLKDVYFLLETPKDDDPGDDLRNLARLKGLIKV